MTATRSTDQQALISPKDQFLTTYEREHATTLRVLRAFPPDKLDLRPAPRCNSARQLAWTFVLEQGLAERALTTGFDWTAKPPSAPPPPPDTMDEILQAFEAGHRRVAEIIAGLTDEQLLTETVSFFVKPKTLGDVPKIDFIWMLLHDQIHHRGQFSIYLRVADAKVPSIYGPTADEPWV